MKFVFLILFVQTTILSKSLVNNKNLLNYTKIKSSCSNDFVRNLMQEIVLETFLNYNYEKRPVQSIFLNHYYKEHYYKCNFKNTNNNFCLNSIMFSKHETTSENINNYSTNHIIVYNPYEMLCRKMIFNSCMGENYDNNTLSLLFKKILSELNNPLSILNIELNEFVEKENLINGFIKMEKSLNYANPEIQVKRLLNSLTDSKIINSESMYEDILEYVNFITETINLYVHMYVYKKTKYIFKIYKFKKSKYFNV